jgi:hypothetical protein
VALRFFDEVNGSKKCANTGKSFVGWSSKFDNWRSSTCTSIMPEFSVHTPYIVVESKRQNVRNDVSDKAEIYFVSHHMPTYCVTRAQRPELLYNDIARHA